MSLVCQVGGIMQILKAMLEDIDAGVLASVANAARGEVFDAWITPSTT